MTVLLYLRKLLSKWMEMVTGGVIAVSLAVHPYTKIPAPPRWVFWTALAGAWAVASFRVWRDSYLLAEEREHALKQFASSESARVRVAVAWNQAEGNGTSKTQLFVRNVGRAPLREFAVHRLQLGLWSVEFHPIPVLRPDVD